MRLELEWWFFWLSASEKGPFNIFHLCACTSWREEGLCSPRPDPGSGWTWRGGERGAWPEVRGPGGGWEGRARSSWLLPPSYRPPHALFVHPSVCLPLCPDALTLGLGVASSVSASLCALSAASEGSMAQGWTLGVGHSGKQREKMGIKLRDGQEGGCDSSGAGKERGMGRSEA